ncbi:serine protease [Ruegeria sp. HKCCD8929]|uniref:S1 family peptidase n=1 Tax=Ruegeria sp. HKCCD8929 TaxID=2683006 RepID=UPI0014884902
MTTDVAPVVRILHPFSKKWVGCGFVIPSPPYDRSIHVMTCAHVVTAALELKNDETISQAPKKKLAVQFSGVRRAKRNTVYGKVLEEHWYPSPPIDVAPTKDIYDIAVIRLEIETLPEGAAFAPFADDAPVMSKVMAFGPKKAEDTAAQAHGNWTISSIRGDTEPDRIEFLSERQLATDQVHGGFSGGPLVNTDTGAICGMVRSAETKKGYVAYALPFSMLLMAWENLGLGLRSRSQNENQGRRSSNLPVFDLFNRDDQVTAFHKLLSDSKKGKGTRTIFTVAGDPDEDHHRFSRRIGLELDWALSEDEFTFIQLKQVKGVSMADGVDLTLKKLSDLVKAESTKPEDIALAMTKHEALWFLHYFTPARFTDEEAGVLKEIVQIWVEISNHAQCECHLGISFFYDPVSQDSPAWAAHQDILKIASASLEFAPLGPLDKTHIDDWPDTIERHLPELSMPKTRKLARKIRGLVSNDNVSMFELMERIDESDIELNLLEPN